VCHPASVVDAVAATDLSDAGGAAAGRAGRAPHSDDRADRGAATRGVGRRAVGEASWRIQSVNADGSVPMLGLDHIPVNPERHATRSPQLTRL